MVRRPREASGVDVSRYARMRKRGAMISGDGRSPPLSQRSFSNALDVNNSRLVAGSSFDLSAAGFPIDQRVEPAEESPPQCHSPGGGVWWARAPGSRRLESTNSFHPHHR